MKQSLETFGDFLNQSGDTVVADNAFLAHDFGASCLFTGFHTL